MDIGTQVHHRRYGWMVGTVKDTLPCGDRKVQWDHEPPGQARWEHPGDLRATPVQPIPTTHVPILEDALNGRR